MEAKAEISAHSPACVNVPGIAPDHRRHLESCAHFKIGLCPFGDAVDFIPTKCKTACMASLRLSAIERVILQLLRAERELYGLDLVKKSEGEIKRGTVYVTLGRMAEKGYVDSRLVDPPIGSGGLPRRMFRMTDLGLRVLQAAEWVAGLALPEGARA